MNYIKGIYINKKKNLYIKKMSLTAKVSWMQQMVSHCFDKTGENSRLIDKELTAKFQAFIKGELAVNGVPQKTMVIYYQKPARANDKNDSLTPIYLVNE